MDSPAIVVGASGFLGGHVLRALRRLGPAAAAPRLDLLQEANAVRLLAQAHGGTVVNCAGMVGGIGANAARGAEFYRRNLLMGTFLMEVARQQKVDRYVQVGTVCSYPDGVPQPAEECDLWGDLPEASNAGYGLAKRAVLAQAQLYALLYAFPVVCPVLANLYGPGDHYEPARSHVIPALVHRFHEAVENGAKTVTLWGSGLCTREFLYVEDAAEAVAFLTRRVEADPVPINVASGQEVRVRDLAEMIAKECGYRGALRWDRSRPDGNARRNFDTSKMARLGWRAKTRLAEGLRRTIADYRSRRKQHVLA